MLQHLHRHGSDIEAHDKEAMLKERDHPWTPAEHLVMYFNCITNAMKQLHEAGITSSNIKQKDCMIMAFQKCSDFNKIIDSWETKPMSDQSWTNLKTFILDKFAKLKVKMDD